MRARAASRLCATPRAFAGLFLNERVAAHEKKKKKTKKTEEREREENAGERGEQEKLRAGATCTSCAPRCFLHLRGRRRRYRKTKTARGEGVEPAMGTETMKVPRGPQRHVV